MAAHSLTVCCNCNDLLKFRKLYVDRLVETMIHAIHDDVTLLCAKTTMATV